jgi:hypothetical protein
MSSTLSSIELSTPSFTLLIKALLKGLELGGSLPWDELRAGVFPSDVGEGKALAYASALQRAFARAALESWMPSAFSDYLQAGGLNVALAECAASAWAAGANSVAEAIAKRIDARPLVTEPPQFVAVTGGATSSGESGEARAVISVQGCEFEATKADLSHALAAFAQLKKALATHT